MTGCCFVVEARLDRHGPLHWDPLQSFPEGHWQESLEVFGAVTVLARVREVPAAPPVRLAFPASIEIGALPYYVGPAGAIRNSVELIRAARHWARQDRLFIVRGPGFLSALVGFWRRRFGKAYAVEVLGDLSEAHRFIEHPLSRLWIWFFDRMTRITLNHAAAVMYVSQALARTYPVPPEVLMAVVSDVRLTDAVYTRPRRFPQPPSPLRVIQVGNMQQPYKGFDVLLEALARCRQAGVAVDAVLVGDGRYRRSYQEMAAKLGLSAGVRFTGAVAWGVALFELLDQADVFVLASRTEGLPKALLEAMARGLPAIGTAVGGIPELLPAEALVPPGDARALARRLGALAGDPATLTRWSARNFERSRDFAQTVLSRKRTAFYQQVMLAKV